MSCHIARDLESGIWNLEAHGQEGVEAESYGVRSMLHSGETSRLPCRKGAQPPYEIVPPTETRLANCQRGFG